MSERVPLAEYFYPRSPCGERLDDILAGVNELLISIHALLAESDTWQRGSRITYVEFLSTLSLRRATGKSQSCGAGIAISIHALLAESDGGALSNYFGRIIFLSTLSLRRATRVVFFFDVSLFLSTLSLRRATAPNRRLYHCNRNFYPRSPCGERHGHETSPYRVVISIHALLAESDSIAGRITSNGTNFYPRSPCGERLRPIDVPQYQILISIHALLAESD